MCQNPHLHLLLADGHGLLVPHDDPKLGLQDRTAELEADPVARHVLSKNYCVFESDTDFLPKSNSRPLLA